MGAESRPRQPGQHFTQRSTSRPPGRTRIAHALEVAALFVLLLVIGMRPLLSETYDSGLHAIARAAEAPESHTPATTAFFDLAIWLAALATAVAAGLQRLRWRWTGIEPGWIVLLIAAAVSTVTAGNQRLAINASCNWLTAIIMLAVVTHLCRDRLRVALVLSVIVASGVASAAKCGMQTGIEFAETREHYERSKETFWQRQGVALDDPQVELFERRMAAREATGFFPHSNAQGAWLSLAGFAALAAAGGKARTRWRQTVLAGVAFLLLSSVLMTGSWGAVIAMLVGLSLWALLGWCHNRLRRHWRKVLIVAWLAVVVGATGLVAIGRARGGLPGASLNFRWQYWQVTGRIIQNHLWTGVGALNFDRAYLPHKPIICPEEIKDPHNFVLAIFSQWGVLGGAGAVMILIGASIVLARAWGQRTPDDETVPVEPHVAQIPSNAQITAKWWLLAVLGGYLLLRVWLLRGLWSHQAGAAALGFDLGLYGVLWGIAAVGTLWVAQQHTPDEPDLYRIPVLAGMVAFLLHNAIDFSLFFPGTLTPFMAMGGLLLAGRQKLMPEDSSICRRFALTAVATVGLIGLLVFNLVPVSRSARLLSLARRQGWESAAVNYRAAAEADPLDPTPLVELAALQVELAGLQEGARRTGALNRAVRALGGAILRDPHQIALYQRRAALLELRYQMTGATMDLLAAIGAARQCVQMYPASPDRLLDLADLLARTAPELEAPALAGEAIEHYRQAIALNDARPGTDEVRRWPPHYRQQVLDRMHALETHPATQSASGQ